MKKRRPISVGEHHYGLIGMSAIGIVLFILHLRFSQTTLSDYLGPGIAVMIISIAQLIVSLQMQEKEYQVMTTEPFHPTLSQNLQFKFPSFFLFPCMFIWGAIKVGILFLMMMMIFYPYQKKLVLRSINEFKDMNSHFPQADDLESNSQDKKMRQPPQKKLYLFRFIILVICYGIFLGIMTFLIKKLFNIEDTPEVGGAISGGGAVLGIIIFNYLRSIGKMEWLFKNSKKTS